MMPIQSKHAIWLEFRMFISRFCALFIFIFFLKHFETLPEMVKYYNYNKLKIASNISIRLQIHSKYVNI